jgi:hypothetical protein
MYSRPLQSPILQNCTQKSSDTKKLYLSCFCHYTSHDGIVSTLCEMKVKIDISAMESINTLT